MRCDVCDQGERLPVRRAKLTERAGRVAVVLGVPMEECPACGERWLDFDIARRLDALITAMLVSDAEIVTRHFDTPDSSAA
jgi:YgiT-type zinc finger domain-containing protein